MSLDRGSSVHCEALERRGDCHVQRCGSTLLPVGQEYVRQARGPARDERMYLLTGTQSSRRGNSGDDIPQGIITMDPVTITSA